MYGLTPPGMAARIAAMTREIRAGWDRKTELSRRVHEFSAMRVQVYRLRFSAHDRHGDPDPGFDDAVRRIERD